MKTVKLKSIGKLRYDKRSLVQDEEFDAADKDAKVLVAIGKAKYATIAKQVYETRVMTATEPQTQTRPMTAAVTEPSPPKSSTLTLPKKTVIVPAPTTVAAQTFKP